MSRPIEALINVHLCRAIILTTDEYEQLSKEVIARALAQDVTLAERILAQILDDNAPRYHEAKRQNERSNP